jgi:hypothetical protein
MKTKKTTKRAEKSAWLLLDGDLPVAVTTMLGVAALWAKSKDSRLSVRKPLALTSEDLGDL